MRATERRIFGITDGLILVAATAIGLATIRLLAPEVTPEAIWKTLSTPPPDGWSFSYVAYEFLDVGWLLVTPGLAAWTLATLALRLRTPRQPCRRLTRQPGMMACLLAAVTGLVAVVGPTAWAMAEPDPSHYLNRILAIIIFGSLLAGSAVLSCWTTMAVCGRWRPEPTSLDQLGRFLGILWIITAGIHWFFMVDRLAH